MIGTLLGAFIIGVLANGLILLGLSDFLRQMITGVAYIAGPQDTLAGRARLALFARYRAKYSQ